MSINTIYAGSKL